MSHRADATACSKRMKEGCPSSGSVPLRCSSAKLRKIFETSKKNEKFLSYNLSLRWAEPRRQAPVCFVAARIARIDDGVNEIQMTVTLPVGQTCKTLFPQEP